MQVICLTSDKYLPAIRPFSWLFNKYWGADQEVIVAGFTPPDFDLPRNVAFHSIGAFSDYPVTRWSDAFLRVLDDVADETFVLFFEDYFPVRPVNVQAVRMLDDYMRQFRYVLKMDLCADRLYAAGMQDYGRCGYIDLVQSDPASQYHMSLMAGVWNRDLLKRFIIPGETPWQVELEGTPRVRHAAPDVIVLGTRQWPVRHALAFRGGDSQRLLLDDLDPADVAALTRLGYLKPWGVE